jgi:hypothetical protein
MSDKYFTSPQRFEFLRSIRESAFQQGQISKEQHKDWQLYIDECQRRDAVPDINNNPSLEQDLRYSKYISDKCKESEIYSQNLYAALCNNEFSKQDKIWSCSWRSAGGIVSNLREEGDYINWYCSGIGSDVPFLPESVVSDEIRKDIEDLGWTIIENIHEDSL